MSQPPLNLNELLGNQFQAVMNGRVELRKKAIDALDPEKKLKVLTILAPQQFAGLPELQKEIEAARKTQQEERQKEQRRLMPRKIYGKWPGLEKEQLYERRDLAVTTDFRAVLGELVTGHLGQKDLAQVFPGYRPTEPLGLLRS